MSLESEMNIKKCKHCGSSFEDSKLSVSEFCCSGCEVVYSILRRENFQLINKVQNNSEFYHLDSENYLSQYTEDFNEMIFFVEGIQCASCLWILENLPQWFRDVESVEVNMSNSTARVRKLEKGKFSEIAQVMLALGYRVRPLASISEARILKKQEEMGLLKKLGVALACTGNMMLLSVSVYSGAIGKIKVSFEFLSMLLFLPVFFYSMIPLWQSFQRSMKTFKAHVDVPIVIAVLAGTLLSFYNLLLERGDVYFDSLAMLVTLLLVSRFFLKTVQNRFLDTDIAPELLHQDVVERVVNGITEKVNSLDLQVGDTYVLKAGQRLPVDSVVLSESVRINPSMISGESIPKLINRNEECLAGVENLNSDATYRVEKSFEHSYVNTLFNKVLDQYYKKTESQSFADRLARIFTLVVLGIAGVFLAVGLFISPEESFQRALAFIIVACPCALAFSVPLIQSLGLLSSSKLGLLVKNAEVFDKVKEIKNLFFDKTGTLTEGRFQVLELSSDLSQEEKSVLVAIEQKSNHPVARALVEHFLNADLLPVKVEEFKESIGSGVEAIYGGSTYVLKKTSSNKEGQFVDYLKDGELISRIELGDRLKFGALESIQKLQKRGLNLFILSGDTQPNVLKVANLLGIKAEQAFADLLPHEKVEHIQAVDHSLMVGDGANDCAALSEAEVSVAVQGSVEASLKIADVYMLESTVEKFYQLFVLSDNVRRTTLRNLYFSVFYNLLAGVAALSGFLTPLWAAVLMPVSSIIILSSSLIGMRIASEKEMNPKNEKMNYLLEAKAL